MSYGNDGLGAGEPQTASSGESHVVDTAKQEAADLKGTATDAAKDVAGTAKDEASSVAHEAKAQVTDLYYQARHEFTDQASKQQERIATGLSSLGDQLGAMARSSDDNGMAGDLVQKISERVSGVASWLNSRDPSMVLTDVKAFARRRPGAFIGGALVAGVLAGRLTRALATNAKEQSEADAWAPASTTPALPATGGAAYSAPTTAGAMAGGGTTGGATAQATTPLVESTGSYTEDTPVYSESESRWSGTGAAGQGVSDDRSDTI